jgi:hypothetical protein
MRIAAIDEGILDDGLDPMGIIFFRSKVLKRMHSLNVDKKALPLLLSHTELISLLFVHLSGDHSRRDNHGTNS